MGHAMKPIALLKVAFEGLIFAFQLLTIVPITKQVPYQQRQVRFSVLSYPIVGIFLGIIIYGLIMLTQMTTVSLLIIALLIVTISIVYTGGLHLDGWVDCSDAFFSYRDQEKKLEIMKDSRIGAFAALSLLLLLAWKYVLVYEVITTLNVESYLVIILIPFLSRINMGLKLYFGKLARNKGMAWSMQKFLVKKDSIIYGLFITVLMILVALFFQHLFAVVVLLIISSFGYLVVSSLFDKKHFGGITGDTLGASVEGGELWLWMTLYLLLSLGMG